MCGRYALYALPSETIEKVLGFAPIDEHGAIVPRWNVAPTQRAPVVRVGADGRREPAALRWGLVPAWAKDLRSGARCVNARSEDAASKPSFRAAWRARRCLVPANGFYEWTKDRRKRAFLFRAADGAPFLLAGLWESWTDATTGEVVDTFAILTRAAYAEVAAVHDRSPCVLPPDRWDAWLDRSVRDAAALARVLDAPAPQIVGLAVGPAVNDARNEGPDLVAPAT